MGKTVKWLSRRDGSRDNHRKRCWNAMIPIVGNICQCFLWNYRKVICNTMVLIYGQTHISGLPAYRVRHTIQYLLCLNGDNIARDLWGNIIISCNNYRTSRPNTMNWSKQWTHWPNPPLRQCWNVLWAWHLVPDGVQQTRGIWVSGLIKKFCSWCETWERTLLSLGLRNTKEQTWPIRSAVPWSPPPITWGQRLRESTWRGQYKGGKAQCPC